MTEEQIDWFSLDVEFPKTGFVHFYIYNEDDIVIFYPIPYIIFNLEDIAEVARDNIIDAQKKSISFLRDILIVPLIFEGHHPQKKSFWTDPEKTLDEFIAITNHLDSLLKNPESVRAIVTCSYVEPDTNAAIFSWSGFYKATKNHTHLAKTIKASTSIADERIKNCGIYQCLRPFGFNPFTQTIKEGEKTRYMLSKLVD